MPLTLFCAVNPCCIEELYTLHCSVDIYPVASRPSMAGDAETLMVSSFIGRFPYFN